MSEKTKKRRKSLEENIYLALRLVFALLLILIGSICALYNLPEDLFESQFYAALTLSPTSKLYDNWVEPPLPIFMKFYIFNVTNGEEVTKGGKPVLQECGPYTYRMEVVKKNVMFYSNSTVSYYNHYLFFFESNMSVGNEYDVMNYVNVPLAYINSYLKGMPFSFDPLGIADRIASKLEADDLFTQNNVREILFGHHDPIFAALNNIPFLSIGEEFGFFQRFNDSNDGLYLMYTGQKNRDRANQIAKWNGRDNLTFWSTKYANMINGSDGSFLGHKLTAKDTPYMFFSQMCRSMLLQFDKMVNVGGLSTLRFHLADDFFSNRTETPNNAGFCVPTGNCYDSGVLNAEPCMEGLPGFLSLPHFYNAAQKYLDAVVGLSPDKESHDSFYYAEPLSGLVVKSQRRFQMNVLVQPSYHFSKLKNIRETILPVLWLDASFQLRDQDLGDLTMALGISKWIWITSYLILLTGCIVLFATLSCHFRVHRRFFRLTYTKGIKANKQSRQTNGVNKSVTTTT